MRTIGGHADPASVLLLVRRFLNCRVRFLFAGEKVFESILAEGVEALTLSLQLEDSHGWFHCSDAYRPLRCAAKSNPDRSSAVAEIIETFGYAGNASSAVMWEKVRQNERGDGQHDREDDAEHDECLESSTLLKFFRSASPLYRKPPPDPEVVVLLGELCPLLGPSERVPEPVGGSRRWTACNEGGS
jgi:hypothetical protein